MDALGKRILNHLIFACERGVEINLILDGIGSMNSYSEIKNVASQYDNFNLHLYNPVPWPFSRQGLPVFLKNRKFFSLYEKINNRNHSKILLFDEDTLFLGSHNFFNSARFWRETSVRVSDPEVTKIVRLFFQWLVENSFFLKRSVRKKLTEKVRTCEKLYISNSIT